MAYFLIYNSDGDTMVMEIAEAKLLKELNASNYGERPMFMVAMPESDTNYWPEGALLLIRGEIVVPVAEQVVTAYKLPCNYSGGYAG